MMAETQVIPTICRVSRSSLPQLLKYIHYITQRKHSLSAMSGEKLCGVLAILSAFG